MADTGRGLVLTAGRPDPSMDRKQINDLRLSTFTGKGRVVAFVCECADAGCHRAVTLTAEDVAELRSRGEPILAPGHQPDADAPLRAEAEETANTEAERPLDSRGRHARQ